MNNDESIFKNLSKISLVIKNMKIKGLYKGLRKEYPFFLDYNKIIYENKNKQTKIR